MKNLMDMTIEELEQMLVDMGQQRFRAKQIFKWVNSGINSIDDMTNISKQLRQELSEVCKISRIKLVSKLKSKIDSTAKYLFELEDGNIIESVLMEYKYGFTACISSQAGCKMGCTFCASTGANFSRNLTAGEMLDQVMTMQQDSGNRIGHIVLMGIGEPLDNYDNVIKFLRIVNHPDGLKIGFRNISLSTCGIVPKILQLSEENIPITLSISLHSARDDKRSEMMPINRSFCIDKLISACKIYTERTKRRISFEYAMISGENDSEQDAKELAGLLKGMLCHVNLIPVNIVQGNGYKKSSRIQIDKFKNILESRGIETTVRRELGSDINAACGQLRKNRLMQ
ncbi:23S rRNA (adenine(2503)-C(2))-methyltransferase RlmN [Ruminiclostridium herbifermentans]|uniref:Probable dual-specificity RNA methyltransferase RlmN n=1 Tax=Ruminiclostridium herbifermentans TaxID=2488810 RepID=A0A4U7J9X5_9FIRM|nr:23S rRNA (adenine(2503)-C(2))-methyltransferase RlmN [Ruminiclostridium herbifermentans]QNU65599.1 23S rRNA (adenine(2503)-C(2))-methyltransferase RlmN [Ruminiclostridium herbifermentans]